GRGCSPDTSRRPGGAAPRQPRAARQAEVGASAPTHTGDPAGSPSDSHEQRDTRRSGLQPRHTPATLKGRPPTTARNPTLGGRGFSPDGSTHTWHGACVRAEPWRIPRTRSSHTATAFTDTF